MFDKSNCSRQQLWKAAASWSIKLSLSLLSSSLSAASRKRVANGVKGEMGQQKRGRKHSICVCATYVQSQIYTMASKCVLKHFIYHAKCIRTYICMYLWNRKWANVCVSEKICELSASRCGYSMIFQTLFLATHLSQLSEFHSHFYFSCVKNSKRECRFPYLLFLFVFLEKKLENFEVEVKFWEKGFISLNAAIILAWTFPSRLRESSYKVIKIVWRFQLYEEIQTAKDDK